MRIGDTGKKLPLGVERRMVNEDTAMVYFGAEIASTKNESDMNFFWKALRHDLTWSLVARLSKPFL